MCPPSFYMSYSFFAIIMVSASSSCFTLAVPKHELFCMGCTPRARDSCSLQSIFRDDKTLTAALLSIDWLGRSILLMIWLAKYFVFSIYAVTCYYCVLLFFLWLLYLHMNMFSCSGHLSVQTCMNLLQGAQCACNSYSCLYLYTRILYIYTHTHTHTHIHIYIYICMCIKLLSWITVKVLIKILRAVNVEKKSMRALSRGLWKDCVASHRMGLEDQIAMEKCSLLVPLPLPLAAGCSIRYRDWERQLGRLGYVRGKETRDENCEIW